MIFNLLSWYLVVALAGWLAFPLAFRLLAFLPDRGLALSRPLGLLLWGYSYWLLVSLGVLQNNAGGAVVALALMGGFSLWSLRKGSIREVGAWLRQQSKLVLVTELLFLLLFAMWALVRAANPDASGTEKPMELAFINSILRSPAFPPSDPWLSGYAISYYYFGYVMVAVLARLSATPGAVAFNLAIATWFALTGLAAYGLLYNLLKLGGKQILATARELFAPLLAPLFVLVVSNLEGFLEVLHACGAFWQNAGSGSGTSTFWQWLNIQELVQPPAAPLNCVPNRPGGIWWWRASRVLQDFDASQAPREIIDEFPMFSYLLGDLHPHVLAMPFVLLAIGLAFNMYLSLRANEAGVLQVEDWIRRLDFWAAAIILGGLSFLNTWDFPIYVALYAATVALAQGLSSGWRWSVLVTFVEVGVVLGIAGAVLYLPFYLGFASQASGLLPSLVFFTRGTYFWLMFGPLLLPILAWLVWLGWRSWRSGRRPQVGIGLLVAAGLVLGLWLLSTVLGLRDLSLPSLAGTWGAGPGAPVMQEAFTRRIQSPGTWLSLLIIVALTWGLLQTFRRRASIEDISVSGHSEQPSVAISDEDQFIEPTPDSPSHPRSTPFVLLLVLLGSGLTLLPEFFYLHDQFGWRMNTIFKFYFQAWMVWAIAAAFASVVLFQSLRRSFAAILFPVLWVALLMMSLVYPYYGVQARTGHLDPATWTLDGSAYAQRGNPQEMQAIHWLQSAPYGVVTEAVGGSYTAFARVSMFSGLPTVLGWPGHESQWRGGAKEIGTREPDITQLYRARTWDQVQPILIKYNIRYIFVGSLERSQYHPSETVFQQNLQPVFHNDTVTIYEVPQTILQLGQAAQP